MKVQEIPPETEGTAMEQEMAGAQDTIYLCNFRVSVDGEWLCLKELHDVEFNMQESLTGDISSPSPDTPIQPFGMKILIQINVISLGLDIQIQLCE